jgi:hypothetical protein
MVAWPARSFLHISRPRWICRRHRPLRRWSTQGAREPGCACWRRGRAAPRPAAPASTSIGSTMGGSPRPGWWPPPRSPPTTAGRIKKHELTRPAKEDDRVRQIDALDAQTGPVFLVYRANRWIDASCWRKAPMRTGGRRRRRRRRSPSGLAGRRQPRHRRRLSTPSITLPRPLRRGRPSPLRRGGRGSAAERGDARDAASVFPLGDLSARPDARSCPTTADPGPERTRCTRPAARVGEAFRSAPATPVQPDAPGRVRHVSGWPLVRLRLDPARSRRRTRCAGSPSACCTSTSSAPILGITTRAATSASTSSAAVRGLDGLAAPVDAGRACARLLGAGHPMDEL